jgi:hypothetical protein
LEDTSIKVSLSFREMDRKGKSNLMRSIHYKDGLRNPSKTVSRIRPSARRRSALLCASFLREQERGKAHRDSGEKNHSRD